MNGIATNEKNCHECTNEKNCHEFTNEKDFYFTLVGVVNIRYLMFIRAFVSFFNYLFAALRLRKTICASCLPCASARKRSYLSVKNFISYLSVFRAETQRRSNYLKKLAEPQSRRDLVDFNFTLVAEVNIRYLMFIRAFVAFFNYLFEALFKCLFAELRYIVNN